MTRIWRVWAITTTVFLVMGSLALLIPQQAYAQPALIIIGATSAPPWDIWPMAQPSVNGSGFTPNANIVLEWDGVPLPSNYIVSTPPLKTDASGAFSIPIHVPPSSKGLHVIGATDGTNVALAGFQVSYRFTYQPKSGKAGTMVSVTGMGFGAGLPITIKFGGNIVSTVPNIIVADNKGSFNASFVVPPSFGSQTVEVKDSANNGYYDIDLFTFETGVSITPNLGSPGSTVTIAGTGLTMPSIPAGALTFDTAPWNQSPITVSNGSFSATLTVPNNATSGAKLVALLDAFGSLIYSTTFVVVSGTQATSINLNPASGVGSVTVTGKNFTPSSSITIKWDGIAIPTVPASLTTDSGGSFTAMLSIPTATSPGSHTVEASDVTSLKASATFTVPDLTGPAGPPGSSGTTYSYQVNWLNVARSLTIPVGAETTIPITLANLGSKTWVAGGSNPVRLTYHLLNNSRQVITWDGLRTYLPYDIAPGKSLTLNAAVKAPSTPGAYILLFDLVEEGVTWFQFQGSPVIDVGLSAPPNYSASIMVRYIPTLKAGQEVSASVLLTNTGSKKWASSGNNPVVLTYHWLDTTGGVIVWDGLRTSFPQDVASSDNILLQAKIKAPPQAGAYSLLFDLVEEGVTWFQAQGSTVWEAQVVVLP